MKYIIYWYYLFFLCSCSKIKHQQDHYCHWTDSTDVLAYYEGDSLKQKAARFLINNMEGAYSVDSNLLIVCEPFYSQYDSLNKVFNNEITPRFGECIDSIWKHFIKRHSDFVQIDRKDVDIMTASKLISEIDLAFKAWKENVYTRNCSFNDFCEYILPYRRINGLIIDDSRKLFYERHHKHFFTSLDKPFIQEADSLLYLYHTLTHSKFYATQTPIYDAGTFERVKHGLCKSRCWYNSLLFSSIGMAIAIDFVPAWGNRNASHSWNVLIIDGKSYAFEPFWDNERWKYKQLYNNKVTDPAWGKFRLPKIFRNTFSNHWEGPMIDEEEPIDNIPSLFINPKKKDVSKEYFAVKDIEIHCKTVPKNSHYGYLCVFGYQQWHPVQWGKIENKKIVFKEMGQDIIYIPACFQNKKTEYLSAPFWLKGNGKICILRPQKEKTTLCIRSVTGASQADLNRKELTCMKGGIFKGKKDGREESLCIIPDTLGLDATILKIVPKHSYRFITLSLPSENIALGDLSFYSADGKIPIKITTTIQPISTRETQDMLTDKYAESAFRGTTYQKQIEIDLGQEHILSHISLTPYIKSQLKENDYFELFYWENGWQSLGKKQGTDNFLLFENVPKGALYMLKNCRWKKNSAERIFIYQDEHVIWM